MMTGGRNGAPSATREVDVHRTLIEVNPVSHRRRYVGRGRGVGVGVGVDVDVDVDVNEMEDGGYEMMIGNTMAGSL